MIFKRRVAYIIYVLGLVALLLTACGGTPGGEPPAPTPENITIARFEAASTTTLTGTPTTFEWEINYTDTEPLTCEFDSGDGGTVINITNCPLAGTTTHTYASAGTYNATLGVSNGTISTRQAATVHVSSVQSIEIIGGNHVAFEGGLQQLTADVTMVAGSSAGVEWTSSDSDIVAIDPAGLATALALGTAQITATSLDDPTKSHVIDLYVVDPMVLEVDTSRSSSAANFALSIKGDGDFVIDWGDGTIEQIKDASSPRHSYSPDGIYTIRVGGKATGPLSFNGVLSRNTLMDLHTWGDLPFTDLSGAFREASNLKSVPGDIPSTVTDISSMFFQNSSFNMDISSWDTSNVTNMYSVFRWATSFNQPLGDWDTSQVTSMAHMFGYAEAFNQPLNSWNTSNVTTMAYMFRSAEAFNQSLSSWNTSSVTAMDRMFYRATSFNGQIDTWDTRSVTTMNRMFAYASNFNQDIGNWATFNVTDMHSLFFAAKKFNQDIDRWDTGSVTDMTSLFLGADSFNHGLSSWDTSAVTTMELMFAQTDVFDQPIGDWDTSSVVNMKTMFSSAKKFDQDISEWCVEQITAAPDAFVDNSPFASKSARHPKWGQPCQ